jgi:hypothetical protein
MRHFISLLALGSLAACAQTTVQPYRFGDSVRVALAQQLMYPDAGRNADPVNGMNGAAGRNVFDRYQKSFSAPVPPPSSLTIGVAGAQ